MNQISFTKLPLQSIQRVVFILCAATFLQGCGATGSAILTGNRRSAIIPMSVTVYPQPPTVPYEVVGIVTSRSVNGLTQQSDSQNAVDELRKQAASLGANGIILNSVNAGSTLNGMIGAAGASTIALVGGHNSQAQLQGTAIYVRR